ncbi:DUF4347 domain-containing protein, partial [Synechococcus sp. AH-551-J03]|nr:DUF4347 domain-containing protein [Synechococcus sp. AH-551-J03]
MQTLLQKNTTKVGISNSMISPTPISQFAKTKLLVADGQCPKIRALLSDSNAEVLWLGPDQEPLSEITNALDLQRKKGRPIKTLHWVSHGSSGVLQSGLNKVNGSALINAASDLKSWNLEEIALWSCEIGADPNFISLWEELTGAQIWSSSSRLGQVESGHQNWTLHSSGNDIQPRLPVLSAKLLSWPHQLVITADVVFGGANETTTVTFTEDVVFNDYDNSVRGFVLIGVDADPVATANEY